MPGRFEKAVICAYRHAIHSHSTTTVSPGRYIILDRANLSRPNRANHLRCLLYSLSIHMAMFANFALRHVPHLFIATALTFDGLIPFFNAEVRILSIRAAKTHRHLPTSPFNHDHKLGAHYGNKTSTLHVLFPGEVCGSQYHTEPFFDTWVWVDRYVF